MKSTSVGRDAEKAVAEHLIEDGFKILAKNWRTRWCEIDIIAQKDKTIYFIEVKYRYDGRYGSGFEYITQKKLNQLKFAANFWVAQNNWDGDYRIKAAKVSGYDYGIIELIEIE
jgi:uncharacterized protein (TIGR00252 family)